MATDTISVTARAADRIRAILTKESAGTLFRISVEGGGCTGFQYKFSFDTRRADNDIVIEREGAVVVVDPISIAYMAGAKLDYVEDLMGSTFRVDNPHATAKCGCGSSFSI
jgi:iron-sulfur cluster assembly accessory protein